MRGEGGGGGATSLGRLLVKAETEASREPTDRTTTNHQTLTSPTAKPSPQPAHRELLSIHTIDRQSV
eukprot:SAG25_NODE_31_length_20541_cov_59.033069_16_plen_67_part_00